MRLSSISSGMNPKQITRDIYQILFAKVVVCHTVNEKERFTVSLSVGSRHQSFHQSEFTSTFKLPHLYRPPNMSDIARCPSFPSDEDASIGPDCVHDENARISRSTSRKPARSSLNDFNGELQFIWGQLIIGRNPDRFRQNMFCLSMFCLSIVIPLN